MEANCLQTDRQTLASYRGARAPKNDHPSTAYDPAFFIAESFPTLKIWMFAKN